MGLNMVMLEGNICQDTELRYTQDGTSVATIRMATNESFYNRKAQERQERTEYHTLVGWGKRFEALYKKECLLKRQHISIIGRLQTRTWEDKQGQKRYTTEVVIGNEDHDFRLLGRRREPSPADEAPPHGDSEAPPDVDAPPVASNRDRPADKVVDDFAD